MARSTFVPLRDVGDDLVRVQARIADALDTLAAAIPASPTRFWGSLFTGRNGRGYIALAPRRDHSGQIVQNVQVGDRVMAALNLTANQDLIFAGSVETVITKTNQLHQLTTANLSANVIALLVVGS